MKLVTGKAANKKKVIISFSAIVATIIAVSIGATTLASAPSNEKEELIVEKTCVTIMPELTTTVITGTTPSTSSTSTENTTVTTPTTTVTEVTTTNPEVEVTVPVTVAEIHTEEVTEAPKTEEVIVETTVIETQKVVETTLETQPIPERTDEDYERVVSEVWKGIWGSGSDRRNKLEAEGYDYNRVQELVNASIPVCTSSSNSSNTDSNDISNNAILSDFDIQCLVVMLCHENSPRAGASHNAHSVAAMVNRVRNGSNGSIYNAISGACSPYWGYCHGTSCMDNFCTEGMDTSYAYDAINYYLNNSGSYSWVTGWYAAGDGIYNVYY